METVKPKNRKVSAGKVAIAISIVAVAAFCAWLFQPRYHGNDDALSALVSIFSILAGFLAAIIAVVANDRALKGRTWGEDTYFLDQVRKELDKHQFLFYLYLISLTLAFVCQLGVPTPWPVQAWLERILLFVSTLAMAMSFALPALLTNRQLKDLEKVIQERMKKETGNKI